MGNIKLDKIDKKLLGYIFHRFREPITKIAKSCRISREQAEYRIKKYQEKGFVKGFFPLFNLYSLGYNKNYIIKLRVKNPKHENLENLPSNNVLIFTRLQCYGGWDYILTIFAKDKKDVINFISKLYDLWGNELLDYDIFEPLEIHFFPLKIFGSREDDKTLSFFETEKMKIDFLDEKIIKIISKNANIRIIELAEKLNEKVETINYRLKRLEKNLILGYRLFLDLEKIDYNLSSIFLKLNNLSTIEIKKILGYSKNREKIHACSIGIGKFNLVFQIIYQNQKELSEEINKIKELFSDKIVGYELVNIEKELTPKTSPF